VEKKTDYNRRSIAETAIYRVKNSFGGSLTPRDYEGQVAEAIAMVYALIKIIKAVIPESVRMLYPRYTRPHLIN